MNNKGMEMVSRSRVVDDARSLLLLPQTSTYGHIIIPRKIVKFLKERKKLTSI
ncbi:unnamed protein product [Brassica rapa subsp. trilocularis]